MQEITVQELKSWLDKGETFQLIDVREQFEYEAANLKAEHIPLGSIVLEADKIDKKIPVVIHCRSGARSAAAIMQLQQQFGYTNLLNLKGGIMAWSKEIDTSLKID